MSSMLVLGLGKSGVATARRLLEQGDDFVIYAGPSTEANINAAREFERHGVSVLFDTEAIEGSFETCIASPGIAQTGCFYQCAQQHSKQVISEPEFAWKLSPQSWIAVTGTNGKTTTTSLVTHLLNSYDKLASACGNIGDTCIDAVINRRPDEILVAELSSYQLASTIEFAPQVAILLNITPDHLSWHGGYDSYAKAKFNIFKNMKCDSTAIISQTVLNEYPELLEVINTQSIQLISVGVQKETNCAYLNSENVLMYIDDAGNQIELAHADELQIKGSHNVENALCASAAALAYGCDVSMLHKGLLSFCPLEHRLEPSGNIKGIEYFNDSKATNVDATLKALTSFPNNKIVLLLGGSDKGTNLDELVAACNKTCAAIIAYGEAGQRFYDAFTQSQVASYLAGSMYEAFDKAMEIAKNNQVVVLSPACASFDEFNSFEHRGEVFKQLVTKNIEAKF